jgi:hypothetical protein
MLKNVYKGLRAIPAEVSKAKEIMAPTLIEVVDKHYCLRRGDGHH